MKGVLMNLTKGCEFMIAFLIDDRSVLVNTIFTGEYVDINGTRSYFLENANNTDKVYTFTETQLTECLPLNDPSMRGSVDELTL